MAASKPVAANRLSQATSPYLLQHQHNPVDWHEWGPEAFEIARREKKPIFLSIGYAACHWCHVMAHESFENAEIAAVMNRLFVNIKVDREERPDLDEIYMQATMILNQGQGGWPMSVWLTPDGKPFYAGTYFPPESRWGRPGFAELCERIGEVWRDQRDGVEADAVRLTDYVQQTLRPAEPDGTRIDLPLIDRTADTLAGAFDANHGGMLSGGTNKFPPSMALDLMLRSAKRRGGGECTRLISLARLTLDRMAAGGIYDHLAGGICRYSTDAEWHVPHFEKMLYDQALVSRSYLDAYQSTRDARYASVARSIFDYVLNDLQAPDGGFYSSRDADSEGEEGKYYIWKRAEIIALLGPERGPRFCRYYDVTDAGNWQDSHAPGEAKNILRVRREHAELAAAERVAPDVLAQELSESRATLLAARAQRVAPGLDDKILCEWNGLMIASLARGGAVLDEPRYVQAAIRAAEFLLKNQMRDGRLLRSWRLGRTQPSAFLADYACLIEALLELYETTFDERWLTHAETLNAATIEHYWDDADGGFFFTADDHEQLLTRSKDVRDSAHPSGNSVQLQNLLRLAALRDDARLRELAERTMRHFDAQVRRSLGASERFLTAVEFALAGPVELVVVGALDDPRTQALLREIRSAYLPNRVLVHVDPSRTGRVTPLTEGRTLVNGQPAVYVCRNYACRLPAVSPQQLREQLAAQ